MIYRPEIDGLRALAVIPIIFFHAGFPLFSGGFVGVDVFFVISGYLITSIILSEKKMGTFSLVGFYERRARRILPALFVVILACIPFACFWAPPVEMKDFSQSLVAVSAFSSNILFWLESGYFDTSSELKPLLHTWSLSLEEQYYALFPVFLLITWRLGKQSIIALLVALFILSFTLAQWGSTIQPEASFYLLPTRGWELLIGSFIAFYSLRDNRNKYITDQTSTLFTQSFSLIGLLLIIYAVFAFNKNTPFPSAYTLIPTIGTGLVLLCAHSNTIIGKLLSNRFLVSVGLISYSAYLWHQPLFAFARLRSFSAPSSMLLLSLILVSIFLAYISWKYIEIPFRNRNFIGRRKIFAFGLAGTIVFSAFGVIGHLSGGFLSRSNSFTKMASIQTVVDSRCHNAGRRTAKQLANGDICTLGAGKIPTFAVIGDSHAGAIFESINNFKSEIPFQGYAISGGFCAPLINNFRLSRYTSPDCIDTTKAAFKKILESNTVTDVVLYAEWSNYTQGYRIQGDENHQLPALATDEDGTANLASENTHIFERSLLKTIDALISAGKRVIIVKPTPEFNQPVITSISKGILLSGSNANLSFYAPHIKYEEYSQRNLEVNKVFDKLTRVSFVDSGKIFCDGNKCQSVDSKSNILFSDTNHVTVYGADLIISEIMKQLHLY